MPVRLDHLGVEVVGPGPGDARRVGRGRDGAGRGERLAVEGELAGEVVVDGGPGAGVVRPGRGDGSGLGPLGLGLGPADVLEGVAEGVGVVGRGPVAGGGEAGGRRVSAVVVVAFVVAALVVVVIGGNAPLCAGSSEGLELCFVLRVCRYRWIVTLARAAGIK